MSYQVCGKLGVFSTERATDSTILVYYSPYWLVHVQNGNQYVLTLVLNRYDLWNRFYYGVDKKVVENDILDQLAAVLIEEPADIHMDTPEKTDHGS